MRQLPGSAYFKESFDSNAAPVRLLPIPLRRGHALSPTCEKWSVQWSAFRRRLNWCHHVPVNRRLHVGSSNVTARSLGESTGCNDLFMLILICSFNIQALHHTFRQIFQSEYVFSSVSLLVRLDFRLLKISYTWVFARHNRRIRDGDSSVNAILSE